VNFLSASVKIAVDDTRLPAQLARAKSLVTRTVSSISGAFGKIATSFRAAFDKVARYAKWAVVALAGIGIASVKMAMNAEESENLFVVSMGKMAASTRAWSEELSKALYLNQYEVRKNVSTFNVMFGSMGLATQAAADMSKGLTKLAYDMASFYNLKPEEAFLKLQAGITGETEPLKRLGILVNETTVKAYAMSHGIGSATGALTEQEKVLARYGSIMSQTTKAQGDMARTIDSTTNVFRSLWSIIKETAIGIGNKLMPAVTEVGIKMRDWVKGNQKEIENWSGVVVEKLDLFIQKVILIGKELLSQPKYWDAIKTVALTALNSMGNAILSVGEAVLYLPTYWKFVQAEVHNAIALIYELADATTNLDELFQWAGAEEWKKTYKELAAEQREIADNMLVIAEAKFAETYVQIEKLKESFKDLRTAAQKAKSTIVDVGTTTGLKPGALGISELPFTGNMNVPAIKTDDERWAAQLKAYETQLDFLEDIQDSEKARGEAAKKASQIASDAIQKQIEFTQNLDNMSVQERIQNLEEWGQANTDILEVAGDKAKEYYDELKRLREEDKSGWEAFADIIDDWAKEAMNVFKQLGYVATHAFDSLAETITQSLMKGKADFKAWGRSVIADIIEVIIKAMIARAVLGSIGLVGGAGGMLSNLFMSPNLSLTGPTNAGVPPALDTGGDILKTGLAVVHKGERVTPADKVGGGSIDIRVHNEGRESLVVSKTESYMMSDKRILDVWMKAKESGSAAFRRKTR